MSELDRLFTETAVPDWSDIRVQFDPDDPGKTIPLSWAQDYIQRAYAKNPARFGAALGDVVADWSNRKYSSDGGA